MRLLTYIQTYDLFHPCHSPLYLLPVTRHILYYLLHTYSFHDDHLKGKKKDKTWVSCSANGSPTKFLPYNLFSLSLTLSRYKWQFLDIPLPLSTPGSNGAKSDFAPVTFLGFQHHTLSQKANTVYFNFHVTTTFSKFLTHIV